MPSRRTLPIVLLARPIRPSRDSASPRGRRVRAAANAASASPTEPGRMTVPATVTATFAFE